MEILIYIFDFEIESSTLLDTTRHFSNKSKSLVVMPQSLTVLITSQLLTWQGYRERMHFSANRNVQAPGH